MIKIAIIEDDEDYRDALATVLQYDDTIKFVSSLGTTEDMMTTIQENKPDVVLMDINLGKESGIEAAGMLKKKWPELKILMLTALDDYSTILSSLRSGANGYLLKKHAAQKLVEAIETVYRGETFMNGTITTTVVDFFKQGEEANSELVNAKLTAREQEILQALIKGLSYKEIAQQCFLSSHTVESHVKNIYSKLNVHSRSELSAKFGKAF